MGAASIQTPFGCVFFIRQERRLRPILIRSPRLAECVHVSLLPAPADPRRAGVPARGQRGVDRCWRPPGWLSGPAPSLAEWLENEPAVARNRATGCDPKTYSARPRAGLRRRARGSDVGPGC